MTYLNYVKSFLILFGFAFLLSSCYQDANAKVPQLKVKSSKVVAVASTEVLQWKTISDLSELQNGDPKKVIVDVYTDWCKWCKVMDEKTFSDPELINYLNANYHLVKLNAETKKVLSFNGKDYDFVKQGKRGYNELAAELLGSRMSYPSFVVLDESFNKINLIKGFKDAKAFKQALL